MTWFLFSGEDAKKERFNNLLCLCHHAWTNKIHDIIERIILVAKYNFISHKKNGVSFTER